MSGARSTLITVLRIRDVYPGSRILIFTHPGSWIQNRGVKKISCHTFLCSHKFHKIEYYFSIEVLKKNLGQFSKDYGTFYPKNLSVSSQKSGFGIRDPGSEIRDPEKTYLGSRIQGSKRHRIPDPQHCLIYNPSCEKKCF